VSPDPKFAVLDGRGIHDPDDAIVHTLEYTLRKAIRSAREFGGCACVYDVTVTKTPGSKRDELSLGGLLFWVDGDAEWNANA